MRHQLISNEDAPPNGDATDTVHFPIGCVCYYNKISDHYYATNTIIQYQSKNFRNNKVLVFADI